MTYTSTIPKRLHRVWMGNHPIPDEYEQWWLRWKQLHPTWDAFTWANGDVQDWDVAPLFPACNSEAFKADLVRIEAIYRFGGVYLDCDMEPLRPIDVFVEPAETTIVRNRPIFLSPLPEQYPEALWNCVFMAPARHPIIKRVLDKYLRLIRPFNTQIDLGEVGPPALWFLWNDEELRKQINWIDYKCLSPWTVHDKTCIANQSYAVHHFCASWNRTRQPEKEKEDDTVHPPGEEGQPASSETDLPRSSEVC